MKNLIEPSIYFSNLAYLNNNYIKLLLNNTSMNDLCFSNTESIKYIKEHNIKPVINYKLDIGLPNILHCKINDKLFISFPGISNNSDRLNCLNFNVEYCNNIECEVHKGFLYIFYRLKSEIELIIDVHKDSCNEIIFTGHSLGGAISKIAALYFKLKKDINSTCITFACPLLGPNSFGIQFNKNIPKSFTLCCQKDFLVKVPFYRYCNESNKYMISDNKEIVSYKDICSSYIYNFMTLNMNSHRLEYYIKYLIKIEFEVPNV